MIFMTIKPLLTSMWLVAMNQAKKQLKTIFRWRPVISGFLLESVLGLFNIFKNNLNTWIECTFSKFADDTKLRDVIQQKEGNPS